METIAKNLQSVFRLHDINFTIVSSFNIINSSQKKLSSLTFSQSQLLNSLNVNQESVNLTTMLNQTIKNSKEQRMIRRQTKDIWPRTETKKLFNSSKIPSIQHIIDVDQANRVALQEKMNYFEGPREFCFKKYQNTSLFIKDYHKELKETEYEGDKFEGQVSTNKSDFQEPPRNNKIHIQQFTRQQNSAFLSEDLSKVNEMQKLFKRIKIVKQKNCILQAILNSMNQLQVKQKMKNNVRYGLKSKLRVTLTKKKIQT